MITPDGPQSSATEAADLAAASVGDEAAFRRLTERYQRELHVHCYRMLGSFHDAEDAMQETLLRAWRHLDSFAGRSSFRAWLYRIATNVCLTGAARRPAEPAVLGPGRGAGIEQVTYLSPYPDSLLDELEATFGNPATEYDLRESVQVAFIAAVQFLPPRQRAVLILREVLGWSAGEVAELLESTTASVNSALQRARATLAQQQEGGRRRAMPNAPRDEVEESLVRRYIEAWHAVDIDRLVGLLKSEAVMTMPPLRMRFVGRREIAEFFASLVFRGGNARYRLVPTRANRQPAVALYRFDPATQKHRAFGLLVLIVEGEEIAELTGFSDPTLFPSFGLPAEL